MALASMKVLDLSQDFGMHTPGFAGYAGPSIRWIKRLAFDTVGGQEITTTLHVGTHLDAPAHFSSGGKFIGELPLPWLVGPACVVDLERMGVGDFELYGPEHFERWERDTGITIERDDILIVHTGYHRYYPENWVDRTAADETRYFIRHPGPTREFAEWVLDRGARWLAIGRRQPGSSDEHGDPEDPRRRGRGRRGQAGSPAGGDLPQARLPDHAHVAVPARRDPHREPGR